MPPSKNNMVKIASSNNDTIIDLQAKDLTSELNYWASRLTSTKDGSFLISKANGSGLISSQSLVPSLMINNYNDCLIGDINLPEKPGYKQLLLKGQLGTRIILQNDFEEFLSMTTEKNQDDKNLIFNMPATQQDYCYTKFRRNGLDGVVIKSEDGNVFAMGIGISDPVGLLHISAGSATRPPIQLTPSVDLLVGTIDGAFEFNNELKFTQSGSRYNIPMAPTDNVEYVIPFFSAANSNVLSTSVSLKYNPIDNMLNLGSNIPSIPAAATGYRYLVADTSGNVKAEASLTYISIKNVNIDSSHTAGTTSQPTTPSMGDAYIIPTGGNNEDWSTFSVGNVAAWNGTNWYETIPEINTVAVLQNGLSYVVTTLNPTTWVIYSGYSSGGPPADSWVLGGNNNPSEFGFGNLDEKSLKLMTAGATRMTISGTDSHVGIGTASPLYPLHVTGSANLTTAVEVYFNSTDGIGSYPLETIIPITIFSSGHIIGSEINVLSDKRIKNILNNSSSSDDLDLIERVEIVNYKYKDEAKYGSNINKKVIAQQVQEVYPIAVKKSSDAIPDIFRKASNWTIVSDSELEITLESHGLVEDEKIRILLKGCDDNIFQIKNVTEHKFVIDFYTHKSFDDIFIYGRFVEDLLNVDYDALSMLNLSATKELKKKVELEARSESSTPINPLKVLELEATSEGFTNAESLFPELCRNGKLDAIKLIPYLIKSIQALHK